jgi:hypothetical protein
MEPTQDEGSKLGRSGLRWPVSTNDEKGRRIGPPEDRLEGIQWRERIRRGEVVKLRGDKIASGRPGTGRRTLWSPHSLCIICV